MSSTLQELILQLKNNQMQYFEEFYENTKKYVFYSAYSVLKDYAKSEDILQEVYINFLKSIKKVDPNGPVVGYLIKISRNLSLNYLKKHKREILQFSELENISKDNSSYYENIDLVDNMKKVLKPDEFQIVVLHVVNEMTHKDIAKLMKKPLGTVTWAYKNAIEKIRSKIP